MSRPAGSGHPDGTEGPNGLRADESRVTLRKPSYDALVVGTGFGGAVSACRLAQAGLDVAVLERGLRYRPGSFPRHVTGGDSVVWHRGRGIYDVRPFNEMFVIQAAGYGGGSLVYANVQMRPPADLFEDWPAAYSRPALDPYYDLVGYMLEIGPIAPPSEPGSTLKTAVMLDVAKQLGRGGQAFRTNIAVRLDDPDAAPKPNRFGVVQTGCTHCGECIVGCNVGAKNTLDMNYLALAESNGAEVATSCDVTVVEPTDGGFRVHYRDPRVEGSDASVEATSVFLCLGAVNTTELLLRCREQHGTLPNLSTRLGEGYSGNGDFLAFAPGATTGFKPMSGPTITTASIYDRTVDGRRLWFTIEDGGYPREIAHLVPVVHPARAARMVELELGQDITDHVAGDARHLGQQLLADDDTAVMLVMGRDRADGHIHLTGRDHRLQVRWDTAANLPLYVEELGASSEIAAAIGARVRLPVTWRYLNQPVAVHNLGGCPMAEDAEHGVVDPDGRVFGYPGLYALDGSILPTATGANPSHTIAAVAERCIELAIRRITGNESWQAPQRSAAVPLVVPEDAVVVPAGGTRAVRAPKGGLRYQVTLSGSVAPADTAAATATAARSFRFEVTGTAVDIDELIADPTHAMTLSGRIWVDGLTGDAGETVIGGLVHPFAQDGDSGAPVMSYTLPFQSATDGERWILRAKQRVQGARVSDLWRALTTVNVTIRPADETFDTAVLTGKGQIERRDVGRLLTSMRAVGGDGHVGAVRSLWRFERFFASSVIGACRGARRTERRTSAQRGRR